MPDTVKLKYSATFEWIEEHPGTEADQESAKFFVYRSMKELK